jgi:hypothetical protein
MTATISEQLEFYAAPGRMTDLSSIAAQVDDLPDDVPSLCRVVQGLLLHPFWAERYGVAGVAERDDELQIREASKILAKALEIDGRPLTEARDPAQRVLGNCRDFTTVTTALLRHKGVPARGRCGFGAYFEPGKYIDHWVVEWWDGDRWVMTDAQLDAFQVEQLKADFDPLDVPHDRFVDAGRAWQLYRSGAADGETFGILDMWGPWFIRGNLARDLASLNKVEMLPWDGWGLDLMDAPLPDDQTDELADVAARSDVDEARRLFATHPLVHVPDEIVSFVRGEVVRVKL